MSSNSTSKVFTSGLRVAGLWTIGRKLGSGSFGDIYHGTHVETKKEVAIKFERAKAKHPQLLYEAKLLRRLQGGEGIAHLYYSGVIDLQTFNQNALTPSPGCSQECASSASTKSEFEAYNVMVTELLGPTLEDLFNLCNRKFTLPTILFITIQLIERIQFLHSCSFIHRDIKPENFLIGKGEKSRIIHMIDYGLSKRYCDPRSGEHIPYREDKSLTGTARYASINAHLGIEQSRRDDMEAAGYVVLYFARGGSLPWQGLRASSKQEKYKLIMEKKLSTSVESLCQNMPREFGIYLRYCHALRFADTPDYDYLLSLFHGISQKDSPVSITLDWVAILSNRTEMAKRLQKLGYPAAPPQFDRPKTTLRDVNNSNNNTNNNVLIEPAYENPNNNNISQPNPEPAQDLPCRHLPFSSLLVKNHYPEMLLVGHCAHGSAGSAVYRLENGKNQPLREIDYAQTSKTAKVPSVYADLSHNRSREELSGLATGDHSPQPNSVLRNHHLMNSGSTLIHTKKSTAKDPHYEMRMCGSPVEYDSCRATRANSRRIPENYDPECAEYVQFPPTRLSEYEGAVTRRRSRAQLHVADEHTPGRCHNCSDSAARGSSVPARGHRRSTRIHETGTPDRQPKTSSAAIDGPHQTLLSRCLSGVSRHRKKRGKKH